jgi:threonyl-tRNA synthetase
MAHPTASSSQPAQIPALDSPHAAIAATNKDKAPKEKKGQGKSTNTSEASPYPLEVRSFCF